MDELKPGAQGATQISRETQRQGASTDQGLGHLYQDWFLDYASYVILDRAIPSLHDGLKPVQRRILHALSELEDGRYNKAANVIGHAMRYHPHGDMAISDAMVKLAQKELLIDTQGNWGSAVTGDRAAAARYIEARLSDFAKEVVFQPEITEWQASYDGRKEEPVFLPIKFPLLLAQGAEGIAVGLSTKILPHNFCELIKAAISILKGENTTILPDFPTGGCADFSEYRGGKKGGRVKLRAVIEILDPKTLCIREIPYSTTTQGLIDSILAAMDKGQIKIKKLQDNTAQDVEIVIHLASGSSPEKMIAALFAFTDCEVSLSPNCCVIANGTPSFCSVEEVLKANVLQTKALLEKELELSHSKLRRKIHTGILEQIFIEEKIYRKIENSESYKDVVGKIKRALKPFAQEFFAPLEDSDIEKLTEIKIKRISKFEKTAFESTLEKLKEDLFEVERNLRELTKFTISYYQKILQKYGKNRSRRTREEIFDKVDVKTLAVSDQRVYVNRGDGFVGTSLKQEEYAFDCSRLDEILAICEDGSFKVFKVGPKFYVGKGILWLGKFQKSADGVCFNLIYQDGKSGPAMAKRCQILSATREKTYTLTKANPGSKLLYLAQSSVGKGEILRVVLKPRKDLKKRHHILDFGILPIKNRSSAGTMLTKHAIARIEVHKPKQSREESQPVWFERSTSWLNFSGNGVFIGNLGRNGKLIALYQSGIYEILSGREERILGKGVLELQKWDGKGIISAIYWDGEQSDLYVKRLGIDEQKVAKHSFLPKSKGTRLILATLRSHPVIQAEFAQLSNGRVPPAQTIRLETFIAGTNLTAGGEKLSNFPVSKVKILAAEPKI